MTTTPKTIQIFLPKGDPRGIRIAEITTRIMQVIEIPRSLLADFLAMPESQNVALYFLVGSTDDNESKVYVGQTGDLQARLKDHNKKKDFWERALVVISRTGSMTQTHALFLEWHCIQAIRDAGRYSDDNGNSGSRPHTPPPLEADCLEIFDTASTLVSALGHPLFAPLSDNAGNVDEEETFYCTGSEADGRGQYTQEGFVVFKGSSGRTMRVASGDGTWVESTRQKLIDSNVMQELNNRFVFQKDHLFRSPSAAAIAVMGRNANGWKEWKNASGQTLDELKRQ